MALLFPTDVLTSLAYLLGERSVNATTSATRTDFVQSTLQEAYQAYPWRFATTTATISIVSGIASLPTNVDVSHPLNATYYNGTTEIDLDEIDLNDKDLVLDGDNKFWLTAQSDGTFLLNTKDTIPAYAIVTYQQQAPILAASVGTPYPSKNTLALGARRYVKLGQNPDADISQDEKLFQSRLSADIAAQQVPAPRRARRTAQTRAGSSTGSF